VALKNSYYERLAGGYLFPEIARRTKEFQVFHPEVKIMRLGIGNTTEPLPQIVASAMALEAVRLMNVETYSGYGDEQGNSKLRQALSERYKKCFGVRLDADEFFISDGSKCDCANISSIFSHESIIAVESPAYPVYVDSNVTSGKTGQFNKGKMQYEGVYYMPCTEMNDFFPEVPSGHVDLIYLCRPNNPTGAVAMASDLQPFVDYALEHKAVIIYDVAYVDYQKERGLVESIYQIPGAEKCAIEIGSFSKWAGFTGVRLGWSIVPKELVVEDTVPGELHRMWSRRYTTVFNGASNIAQAGGLAVLSELGQQSCQEVINYYMSNARLIKNGLYDMGLTVYGGTNAPYIWLKVPDGMSSWNFFDKLLNETNVVCTPGVGFGPDGEGFCRLSAFGHQENITEAIESIRMNLRI